MANAFGKIIANVERLHRLMDEAGVAAVVARSGKNFTYLAGFAYPGTLARHLEFPDSPREVLLVWPRHGEPMLVLNSYAAPLARRDSWLENIEVVDDYAESPYERAVAVLRNLGLAEETIGFEKSYVSTNRWEEIGRLLPRARIVDSTELMDRVRWIKTPRGGCRPGGRGKAAGRGLPGGAAHGAARRHGTVGAQPHRRELPAAGRQLGPRHPELQPQHRGLRRRKRPGLRSG